MAETKEGEFISLIGGYKLVRVPGGFGLRINRLVSGDFADINDIIFNDEEIADNIADVLSRFSAQGTSENESTIRVGDRLKVSVCGGERPTAKFYRYDAEKDETEDEPFFETKSLEKFVAALRPYIVNQK